MYQNEIRRLADLSIVKGLGGFLRCKVKAQIWDSQTFLKKKKKMEAVQDWTNLAACSAAKEASAK